MILRDISAKLLVLEMIGIVLSIDKISDELSKLMYEFINNPSNSYETKTRKKKSFDVDIDKNDKFFEDSKINKIFLNAFFHENGKDKKFNHIEGKYNSNETYEQIIDNKIVYDINIEINLFWDYETNIIEKISSVLSHEIHHAFEDIKRKGKKSKLKPLISLRNNLKRNLPFSSVNEYPEFKEFLNVFYLNIPQETHARVQQVYNEMKKYKNLNNYNLIIKELYKTQPFVDAKNMMNYSVISILKLPKQVQINFIEEFNKNLNIATHYSKSEEENLKYPSEPNEFFNFWQNQINNNGRKLFKKILKVIGAKSEELDESIQMAKFFINDEVTNFIFPGSNNCYTT